MTSALPLAALIREGAVRAARGLGALALVMLVIVLLLGLAWPPIAHAQDAVPASTSVEAAIELADQMPANHGAALNAGLRLAHDGRIGESLLYLERAHLLAPLDREIQDARMLVQRQARAARIEDAGSATVTEGEPAPVAWWRFFAVLPPQAFALLLLAMTWALFGLLVVRRRSRTGAWKDGATVVAILAAVGVLFAGAMWGGQLVCASVLEPAVVVSSEPRFRDSPDELSRLRRHSDLYEGAVVLIRETRDEWMLLELVDGDRVWVTFGVAAPLESGR